MGREILYCDKCGARLASEDFTRGRAFTIDNRSYCATCVEKPAAPPPQLVQTVLGKQIAPDRSAIVTRVIWAGAALASVGLLLALVVILGSDTRNPPASSRPAEVRAELKALETRLEAPLKLEQFGAAIAILKEARKSFNTPEGTESVEKRIQEIEGHAKRLYGSIRDEAVEAKKRGAHEEVAALVSRLSRWGMPLKSSDLESALADVKLAPPIPPGGLRLVPNHVPDGRIRNRIGIPKGIVVEGIGFGPIRAVGFEGDLFAVPSDGEIQVGYESDAKQPMVLRVRITDENNQSIPFDWALQEPAPGQPGQARASFKDFRAIGGRTLPVGSVIKQLFVTGQDKNVAFRVTSLLVVKRRD